MLQGLLLAALLLQATQAAVQPTQAAVQPTQAAVKRIDAKAAGELWKKGYAYLDVRTPEEFATGRVPKSINVPWVLKSPDGKQVQNPKFLQQVRAALPDPATKLIVGCQSGRRSAPAAALLAPHYKNMVENKQGMLGWKAAGLPVAQ